MHLNIKNFYLLIALCLLGGCTTHKTGFWGFAPAGDRQEYTHARDLYNQGLYEQAVTDLRGYIYKTKNVKRREARAYRLLGMSYEQLNQLNMALEVYQEALEFHPRNIPLLASAASLYQKTGLYETSLSLYERILKEEPNNVEALSGMAENYIQMGFYSKARSYYDRFFNLEPNAPAQNRARYAYTFLQQRNFEKAFIHITMALTAESENADFWLLSAKAERGLKRKKAALSSLETALALSPHRTDILAQKALWLYEDGALEKSAETADTILNIDSKNQLALFIKALNLRKQSKPKESRRLLQQVIEINPNSFVGKITQKLLL